MTPLKAKSYQPRPRRGGSEGGLTAQSAFTLIELLVTITISTVMVGLGIAAYNNFNESQTLELAIRKLKTELWAAQTRAVANKQPIPPSVCNNFVGYKVTFANETTNPAQYQIAAQCDEGDVDTQTVTMPTGVTKSLPAGVQTLLFKPRTAGTDLGADLVLTYQFSTGTKTITITPTGEIR